VNGTVSRGCLERLYLVEAPELPRTLFEGRCIAARNRVARPIRAPSVVREELRLGVALFGLATSVGQNYRQRW